MRALHLALTCALALAGTAEARLIRDHRSPSVAGGAHTLAVGPVFELKLSLRAGQRITCRTQNLSPGADPVLHLVRRSIFGGGFVERARDDDSGGGLDAHLTFRTLLPGEHILVLRAAGDVARGTADLFCDDRPVAFALPVGGAFRRLQSIRRGESLRTVPLPKAPTAHVLYVFGEDGRLLERHASGNDQSVARDLGARSTENVMVGSLWPDVDGPIRLVRNDGRLAGHDPDRDGLGRELESDVGTCSTLREVAKDWECSRSADARDTDGDGLRDDLELLGLVTATPPFQLLPRWGADPRHKDLFLEVDSMARSHDDPPHVLSPRDARTVADVYADAETDALLRLLHAQLLGNPDRLPGIRLHFDNGVRPSADAPPEVHTLHGAWGGHTVVPPECDDDGTCRGADGPAVWRDHMHPHRFGIFHYALGDPAGGGQAPLHSVALNLPVASPIVAAHELGHTLGLHHFGPPRGQPDLNCKPNYPSVMSYGYRSAAPHTFSDGQGRASLNNVALRERGAVAAPASRAGARYLADLRRIFGLNVDSARGDVDWDRDGVLSDGFVRAYANDSLAGECEGTRLNAMRSSGRTDRALTLTRLGERTFILSIDSRDRRIWMDFTTDDLTCPEVAEAGCGPALTRRAVNEPWNRGVDALDAHPATVDGERRLLVVFRQGAALLETTLSADLTWSQPRRVPTPERVEGDPSLTGDDDRTLLAFKNARGVVVLKVRHSSLGTWDPDEIARDEAGREIGRIPEGTSPAVLEATHGDGTRVLYGAFALSDLGLLRMFRQDAASGRWRANPFQLLTNETVFGRPALSFEPVEPGSPLPGRMRVLFPQRTEDGQKPIRELTLQAIGLGPRAAARLVGRFHDNRDFLGHAVDVLFEPGVDSNVRVAVATAIGEATEHFIQLRPKADGIVDLEQRNADDWETLGVNLCRTLFLGGARLRCP